MLTAVVMCGLQCSGKSTKAKELKDKIGNCEIVSSDAIRKEFDNNITNDKVFNIYYDRARNFLKTGKNVILDATNLTMKSRKQVFEKLKGINCRIECYIMNTPINVCVERLFERNKDTSEHQEVPVEVLFKYQKSFEIPFYREGWNNIIIDNIEEFSNFQYKLTLEAMDEFDQKNKHHKYNLGKHCRLLEEHTRFYNFPKSTGLFHDIGKMFTQTIDDEGQAHYYQHHNIGAYFLLSHTFLVEDKKRLLELLFYVNYHMLPFDWKTEKAEQKWEEKFGRDEFLMLKILNEGDKKASGTQ